MKACKKCGEVKELSEFYRIKASKEWRSGTCAVCTRAHRSSTRTPEIAQRCAEWFKNNREKQRAYQVEYRKRQPAKAAARSAVSAAISSGQMAPASACECNDCRAPAVDLHHHSYEQEHWLDVVPLCRSCHVARHAP